MGIIEFLIPMVYVILAKSQIALNATLFLVHINLNVMFVNKVIMLILEDAQNVMIEIILTMDIAIIVL
jgi:hypothetical protein